MSELINQLKCISKPNELLMILLLCASSLLHVEAKAFTVTDDQNIQSQELTVSGTVVSKLDNFPLPGVNITVKGTSRGVVTDFDGNYSIKVPSANAVLVFSYVGFRPVEVTVGNQSSINVSIEEDVAALSEVVVVGYGAKKKESLTGAIEQIKSDVFEDRAITSPALSLQGQTPGLTVTRNSPRPGQEGIGLQIRGATSVNGGEPLIMIDGAPAVGTEFYQMNSDDIESISVLKDGSASIYGSRASNGVILVTTKKGKGKMKIEYTGNYRYNVIGIRPPVPSMEEYATLWLEAAEQDGTTRDYWGWDTEENLLRLQNGEEGIYATRFWGDIFIGKANRFDELFGDSESYQHNLSLSGSTDKTNYRLSAAIADNLGALKTAYDGQKQQNVRFNYDFDVTDRLKIQSGIMYQKGKISGPSTGLDATAGSNDPPFFPAYNPYGQWYANFGIAGNRNATAATTDGGRRDQLDRMAKVNFGATYNIMKNLDFRANASYTDLNRRVDEYRLTVQPYTWDGQISPERINTSPLVKAEVLNRAYEIYGAFLDYKISTDNGHNFAFMVGQTAERQKDKALSAERAGLQDLGVYDLNVAPIDVMTNRGGSNHWGIYSTISRFNYDYKEKYLLELVGRRDGSSRFAEGFKFSNFGSITAGWLISSEKFMENTPINYLKLRGSYGTSGNQVGIGLYDYVSSIGTGSLPFGTSPTLQNTAYVNGLTSRARTWEEVKMRNVGLDFGVFQNKLTGAFDLYQKDNNGMLIDVIYPSVLGGTAPKSNSGKLTTTGWEAMLGWKETKGDFSYNISVNMSDNNNELVKMDGATAFQAGLVAAREGYPLNSYFLYKTDGLFQTQEEVDNYYAVYTATNQGELPIQTDATQNIRIGDTKKVDSDGNGYIDDVGGEGDTGDAVYMGDSAPHYVYGINLGASYKGFDFTAFFQGVLEQNVLRSGWLRYPFAQNWTNQPTSYLGKTWTPENTGAAYPRMTANTTRSAYNWQNNDFLLQNNRYMRLKSIVLGYTVPQTVTEKIGFNKVRVYFSGNDLFEWTSIKDGYDPEFGESTQTVYPFSRTYSFGVNLSF